MTMTKSIEQEAKATLRMLEKKDPGLKRLLNKAYGYAVFPSVGKASLVVGGSYGKGAVFCEGKFVGYATIGQTTIGVQIGGDTYAEVLVFQNRQAFDHLKRGKLSFAADASAVLVKAGAAAARGFGNGTRAFVYGKGGMLLEAVIGGQKFNFKPAGAGQKEMGRKEEGEEDDQAEDSAAQDSGEEEGDESGGEEAGGDDESTDLATRVAGAARGAWSGVSGFVKDHPVAAGAIGFGVLAGGTLLAMRMLRSSAQSEGQEDQGEQGEGDESDEQDDEQMSAENEDQDENDDQGEDEESESRGNGRRRRYAAA